VAGGETTELPIFELPVVLLPGELLPLHIFEERYKRMIGRSVDGGEPFGIVLRDEDGAARRVGCTAQVADVIERFDDGRMNIVVAGELPFRVLDRADAPEYPVGEVELIDLSDEPEPDDAEAGDAARSAFAELLAQVSDEPQPATELAGDGSYELAARIELPADTKQRLLELRSEDERMRLLRRALVTAAEAVRRAQRIAEAARGNGGYPTG
jgi:Lon protease-like protein